MNVLYNYKKQILLFEKKTEKIYSLAKRIKSSEKILKIKYSKGK